MSAWENGGGKQKSTTSSKTKGYDGSTLHAFARDARHLGGTPGFTAVLHTWTRQMAYHPHLHVIMPGVVLCGMAPLRLDEAADRGKAGCGNPPGFGAARGRPKLS